MIITFSKSYKDAIKQANKCINNVKIKYIADRPGHDRRYALNSNKIQKKLNWKPQINFDNGLKETFLWYLNNKKYYSSLTKRDIIKRLGLKK